MDELGRAAEVLARAPSVALACHVNPDPDALGSMLGLAAFLHARLGTTVVCSWGNQPLAPPAWIEPLDTWADMSHLIPRERWPHAPRALAYFCNVLPDADAPATQLRPAYAAEQRARVRANAVHFLNHDVVHLWPRAALAPGRFRWDLLVDSADGTAGSAPERGEARFATQFWTANVNPSDRYTLSLPGSNAYRISPLDRTYDNLTIAGDWTDGGFNAGCVEAAVMSGRLAAHAVAGAPRLEDIVGFDHP